MINLSAYLHRNIHISFFIMWFGIAFVLGVTGCYLVHDRFYSLSWMILGIVLVLWSLYRQTIFSVFFMMMGGLMLGLWYGGLAQSELKQYVPYYGQIQTIDGIVAEDTSIGRRGETRLVLRNVHIAEQNLPGEIWLSTYTKATIKRNEHVSITGKLQPGFGAFSARASSAKIIAVQSTQDTARDIRDTFSKHVRQVIKEPEASLGLGFLVGQRSQLPEELDQQLRVAGLTHIIVASGYNLSVLLRLSRRVFSRISKYLTVLFGGSLITGFILITGLTPSMTRAGLVAGLSLAAWYYGRKFNPFVLLSIVALISVILHPQYVWGDIGWYLSFTAFFGVMIVAPLLHHYFFGAKKPGFFRQIIGETIAALLMTIPIILIVFSQFSTYALLANVIIVPIISIIMLLVFIAGITAWFLPVISSLFGAIAQLPLQYVTVITAWVNQLPQASQAVEVSVWFLIIWYSMIIATIYYMWRATNHDFRQDNIVE